MAAYVVVDMNVTEPGAYRTYTTAASEAVARYGGKYIVRGGNPQNLEGDWHPTRIVLLQFDSVEAAERWYHSPEYEAARALRSGCAEGKLVVVEGLE